MEFDKNDPRFYSEDLETYPDVITQNDYHPMIGRPMMVTYPTGMMLPPGAKFRMNPNPTTLVAADATSQSGSGLPWKWIALGLTIVLLSRR